MLSIDYRSYENMLYKSKTGFLPSSGCVNTPL